MTAGRYETLGPLGRGAMGSVDLVLDRVLQRRLARKRVLNARAGDLLRFKLEFRAVERLTHPNLVRLHELSVDEAGPYFTMEVVDGVDLATYCCGDLQRRLPQVLPQILDGLSFLHSHGVVHCDLKPSNILVTFEGSVKLVDFGALAVCHAAERNDEANMVGTPHYLAPERILGEAASPASDIYALGCILFELHTGRTPFDGTRIQVLRAHVDQAPPLLSDLAPEVTSALAGICHRMLDKAPERRPTLAEVRRWLAGTPRRESRPFTPAAPTRGELVAREALQSRLSAWVRASRAPHLLVLEGPTGAGKTALANWLASELSGDGGAVFCGCSRPNERIAFNAWDAAVDDLARWLLRQGRGLTEAINDARVAAISFPVLEGLCGKPSLAVREDVRRRLFGDAFVPEQGSQRDVFEALAALLERAAEQAGGALLVLDDLQWADSDSVALLDRVVDRVSPRIATLLVLRDDVDAGEAGRWLAKRSTIERLTVEPLPDAAILEIVRRSARALGVALDHERLLRVTPAAKGRPFLADVLGRALATGSSQDVDAQIFLGGLVQQASTAERKILALITAADDWVGVSLLARASKLSLADVVDRARALVDRGLLRWGSGELSRATLQLFHDGVRTAVLQQLSELEHRGAHAALARILSLEASVSAERLVSHFLVAGERAHAIRYARVAAQDAERQRAFGLAADMYAIVLEDLDPKPHALLQRHAMALERAGRYGEAAASWLDLANTAEGEQRIDLLLREAHALIAANRTQTGLRRLDQLLKETGQTRRRWAAWHEIGTLVRFIMGPVASKKRNTQGANLQRGLRNVELGTLLSFLDPVRGLEFLQSAQREFLKGGAGELAASCDYAFSVIAMIGSRHAGEVRLATRYRKAADARRPRVTARSEIDAMPLFIDGVLALREGRWQDCRQRLGIAAEKFAQANATTQHVMALSWMHMADAYQQDLPNMKRNYEWFTRHASDCGGTFIMAHVNLLAGYIQYLEGKFDESKRTLTALAEMFDHRQPNIQRAGALLYRHLGDIYLSDLARAHVQFVAALRAARRFGLLRSTYAGPFAQIGAMLEVNCLRVAEGRASPWRLKRFLHILDSAPPLVAGASSRIKAYAADTRGEPEQALEWLDRAEREACRYGRRIDAAIAKYQRGRRLGGDEGRELCAVARTMVVELGASPALLDEDAGSR